MRSTRQKTRKGLGEAEAVTTTAHRLVTEWHVRPEQTVQLCREGAIRTHIDGASHGGDETEVRMVGLLIHYDRAF